MSTGMRKWMEKDCPEIRCLPAQVSIDREELKQLRDRLEAAEKDIAIKEEVIDSLATVIKRLDAQCDDAEKERNTLRTTVRHESDCVEAAKAEIKALRAKVAEMEQQEPVAWTTKLALEYGSSRLGFQVSDVNMWGENGAPLYALPGAKGEEK